MKKHKVRGHERSAPTRRPRPAPMPGQTEFSPEQETAMRGGARQAREAAQTAPIDDVPQGSGIPGDF